MQQVKVSSLIHTVKQRLSRLLLSVIGARKSVLKKPVPL